MLYFGIYFLIGVLMMSAYMSQDPEGYAAMNDKTPFAPAVFLLIAFVLMGLFWLPALVGMLLKGRKA